MIKFLLLCFCLNGALSSSLLRSNYEILDDIENEAEIIEAALPLKGTGNLNEKRVPVIRLTFPAAFLKIPGTRNLAEQPQISYYGFAPTTLPGVENLEEKALPVAGLRRNARTPNSEFASVI